MNTKCVHELNVSSPCKYPVELVRAAIVKKFGDRFIIDEKFVLDIFFETSETPAVMEVVEIAEQFSEFKFELIYRRGDNLNKYLMAGAI